jgi:NhaA family Na+:H+ antiporter
MKSGRQHWYTYFTSPGALLVIVTVFSLALANSVAGEAYRALWHVETGFEVGPVHLHKSLLHWINDAVMVLFFVLVGLEIKRELDEGELSTKRKAMLPLFAASGGMIVPALIYTFFNAGTESAHGWGIPMATDIAFALAVLSMLKSNVPGSIRVFLTALAIIDDLGAVLVIAFFYTSQLYVSYLGWAAIAAVVLFALNKAGVRKWWPYTISGILLWYFVMMSGVHATIAGVLFAVFVPIHKINSQSMLHKLEHALTPIAHYVILPLFAIANTALLIETSLLSGLLTAPALGIFFGLIIGKPVGITLFTHLAVKLKLADLPRQVNLRQIAGAGMLGGIGFTMSIFISMLAFVSLELQDLSKLAILVASLVAGVAGFLWMKYEGKRVRAKAH